jgi:hypothetical protein
MDSFREDCGFFFELRSEQFEGVSLLFVKIHFRHDPIDHFDPIVARCLRALPLHGSEDEEHIEQD